MLDAGYETIKSPLRDNVQAIFANAQRLRGALSAGATTKATRDQMRLNLRQLREDAAAAERELMD